LTRDNQVLEHGRPADILEAVAGVPLDARQLRATLLGCPTDGDAVPQASRRIGDWRTASNGSSELYFRQTPPGRWGLVAVVHRDPGWPEWRAEYRDVSSQLPRTVRLVSIEPERFDLRLALSQVELDVSLPPAAFEVRILPSAVPITIDELRRNGLVGR
jgi:hypothetical protein